MFDRFQPTQEDTLLSRLMIIKQEDTYEEYRKKIEKYAAPIPQTAEDVLREAFMNGLTLEIKAEVKGRHPVGFEDCMRKAQAVNDRNVALKLAKEELGLNSATAQTNTNKSSGAGGSKAQGKA